MKQESVRKVNGWQKQKGEPTERFGNLLRTGTLVEKAKTPRDVG